MGTLARIQETKYIKDLATYKIPKEERSYCYDIGLMLSGPEPTRSHLEERLLSILKPLKHLQIFLVRGLPNEGTISLNLPLIYMYSIIFMARNLPQSSMDAKR